MIQYHMQHIVSTINLTNQQLMKICYAITRKIMVHCYVYKKKKNK